MGVMTIYANGKRWWQQRERKKEWVSPDIPEDEVSVTRPRVTPTAALYG